MALFPTGLRAIILSLIAMFVAAGQGRAAAQGPPDLSGSWTLDRPSSQFPKELGFSADLFGGGDGGGSGGGRGERGGGRALEGVRGPRVFQESQEDARRLRFLTDEVRLPPERLDITVAPAAVTIAPDRGAARTVQPGAREGSVQIGPISAVTTARWDADRLIVAYDAEAGRIVRYTYSLAPSPRQLIVDVEFVGRGGGDKVRRVYTPSLPGAPPAGSATTPPASPPSSGAPPGSVPAAPASTAAPLDQRPDASLKGLTRLGLVVEGIGADGAKCGLNEEALTAAVSRHLTDAGLRVVRDTDDDTYLYVSVNTATAAGLCVSRYDVTVYSHTAAPLAHTATPVLLQVELLHKGGLAGGAPALHPDAVTKSVLEYVDQFTTRIRSANQ